MESYCGKDCGVCGLRETLGCPGCQEGLGRRFSGPCEIAACCREKGHEACATCGHQAGCFRYGTREETPRRELRRREEEAARQARLAERAPVLGKWLWWMFWLIGPREAAGLLTMDQVAAAFPSVGRAGLLLEGLCVLAYGFFLWKLGVVLGDYRTAALCQWAVAVLVVPRELLPEGSPLLILPNLALIALGLLRDYRTYHAHAQVLAEVDQTLADKWLRLWKYVLWVLCGMGASLILLLGGGMLGVVVLVAAALAGVALGVVEMVYLWRTAKVFREYCPPARPALPEG